MRKCSKYRPKKVYVNPVAAVIENTTLASKHGGYLIALRCRNSGALAAVMRGAATRDDITTLMAMSNMCEALCAMGVGKQFSAIQQAGCAAVRAVAQRFGETGRATLRAAEIEALNDYMDLHNAQLELVTVDQVHRAIHRVRSAQGLDRIGAAA